MASRRVAIEKIAMRIVLLPVESVDREGQRLGLDYRCNGNARTVVPAPPGWSERVRSLLAAPSNLMVSA